MWLTAELPDDMEEGPVASLIAIVLGALAESSIPVSGVRVDRVPALDRLFQAAAEMSCMWCGRAVYQNADGDWLAVKGEERGYDPLICDSPENDRHEVEDA